MSLSSTEAMAVEHAVLTILHLLFGGHSHNRHAVSSKRA